MPPCLRSRRGCARLRRAKKFKARNKQQYCPGARRPHPTCGIRNTSESDNRNLCARRQAELYTLRLSKVGLRDNSRDTTPGGRYVTRHWTAAHVAPVAAHISPAHTWSKEAQRPVYSHTGQRGTSPFFLEEDCATLRPALLNPHLAVLTPRSFLVNMFLALGQTLVHRVTKRSLLQRCAKAPPFPPVGKSAVLPTIGQKGWSVLAEFCPPLGHKSVLCLSTGGQKGQAAPTRWRCTPCTAWAWL